MDSGYRGDSGEEKKIIIGQKFIFLQDNDPKQKAKFTMEWLAKNMVVIWSGQVKALTEIPQNIWRMSWGLLSICGNQQTYHSSAKRNGAQSPNPGVLTFSRATQKDWKLWLLLPSIDSGRCITNQDIYVLFIKCTFFLIKMIISYILGVRAKQVPI